MKKCCAHVADEYSMFGVTIAPMYSFMLTQTTRSTHLRAQKSTLCYLKTTGISCVHTINGQVEQRDMYALQCTPALHDAQPPDHNANAYEQPNAHSLTH
jgi:hypothetical protein